MQDKSTLSINAFMHFVRLTDATAESNWENLYDGSIWFKVLSNCGFVSPVPNDQLSLAKSRLARDVNFKVPLLEFIADNDVGPHGQQAIVQMNALVLGVYVHLNGLTTFRKLSEEDEDQLSTDMEDVGAHQSVSVKTITHTEEEHHYYRRLNFYQHTETLQQELVKAQDKFQEAQTDLAAALADQEQSGLELDAEHRLNEVGRRELVAVEEEIPRTRLENDYDTLQNAHKLLDERYTVTARLLETSRVQGCDFILQVETLESNLAEKSMHLENEMIKVVDFEKIILQMKEEYSQLEKENQDVSIKMQNMEKKLNINVTDTANNIHKTCQEKIKELVDQIAEKDLKIEVIKEAVESKENQLKQGLRTISNYMEELEAKQIDIQDLQLQLQENFVPHEPQSLAAELDDTNSLDYSGDEGHLVNVLIVAILTFQIQAANQRKRLNKAHSMLEGTENWWQRRHAQLDISMHSFEEKIQTFQNQAAELHLQNKQLQNLCLEYDAVYRECQMTKETLQSLEDKRQNQAAELHSQNKELQNLHLKYDAVYKECQMTKETLQLLEDERISWEAEQIRMKQTCTELQSQNNAMKKRVDVLRGRLSDTQQKLKRAEIQWNEIEASNQLRLEALAEEVELAKSELTKAQNLVSKRAESDLVVMSAVHALGMREQRDKKK
ncbi:hypothetical protein C8J57DRAFT_1236892 [Mycena rebaudengoi]|nr:hypothetical protein C8J57DRAFT_1236892 [Mycena rebaudengoi]